MEPKPVRRSSFWLGLLAAGCVAVGFDCATLRFLWWTTDLVPGQYYIGYFEESDRGPRLVLDAAQRTSVEPDVGLDAEQRLSLPPGRSLGLPLSEGVEYSVRVDDRHWAPFCVFGMRQSIESNDGRPPAFYLAGSRTVTARSDGVADVDWTIMRPWHDDQRALEALQRHCGAAASQLTVRMQGGQVEIQYGSCSHRLSQAADMMAVLAGPSWTSVQLTSGWRTSSSVPDATLLRIIMAVTVMRFVTAASVVGAGWSAVVAALLFIVATLLPTVGILSFALLLLLGFAAAGVRVLVDARNHASTARVALGFVLILLPIAIALLPFVPSRYFQGTDEVVTPERCLLLGYSSIRGDSLRQDLSRGVWGATGGVWQVLPRAVACGGSVARRARAAGRFSWTEDVMCGAQPGVQPGGQVLFFGGSNDDFFWAPLQTSRLAQVARLAKYAYARPGPGEWQDLAAGVERDSVDALPNQKVSMARVLTCAQNLGARFHYFHDFVAWDLADPRSPARKAMLEARAAAMQQEDASFVDLLDAVRDEVGIWWFNDYIHPSEIGHRRIGEIMIRVLDDGT